MTDALNILHVCAPAPFGGLERVVAALTAGLAGRGHRVTLATVLDVGADVPAAITAAEHRGVDLVPLRLPPRAYGAERHAVRTLARGFGAQILHTHGYRSDVLAGPLAAGVGAARVSTVHGFTGGGPRNRAYEWLQRRALRRCDAVVAVSADLAEALLAAGVTGVSTVVNGAPLPTPPASAAEARRALGASPTDFHIGWVGRLSPEKGPDVFLEALARLPADLSWRASIVGDGPLRRSMEDRAAALGLDGRTRFAGELANAARLMCGFDVVVLSSRREGTPVTLLEAVEAGVPLVATRVGGVPDAVGAEGALFADSEDAAGLAASIAQIHRDPAAARRRAEAARRPRGVATDWVESYEDVYRVALGGAARLQSEQPR
ncbi:MAG: glycosyltransferase [Gemmatimonadota bacterium]